MHFLSWFLSLRRRSHKTAKNRSRESLGSSFEYGHSVHRLSGDFDPYRYHPQATEHPNFDPACTAGIPIRVTTPRSFPLPGMLIY